MIDDAKFNLISLEKPHYSSKTVSKPCYIEHVDSPFAVGFNRGITKSQLDNSLEMKMKSFLKEICCC